EEGQGTRDRARGLLFRGSGGRRRNEPMRKSFAKRIGAVCSVLAVAAAIAVPALVHAHYRHHPCGAGCGFQVKACQKTARASMLSCKMDCRANPDPNDLYGCLRVCRRT